MVVYTVLQQRNFIPLHYKYKSYDTAISTGEVPLLVTESLDSEKLLDEMFEDWVSLLEFRNELNSQKGRVHFLLGPNEGDVCCSLDLVDGPYKLAFDKGNERVYDPAFLQWSSSDIAFSAAKSFVYFRPKNGCLKGQLFRFTAGQSSLPTSKNRIETVVSGFIKILLRGNCSFNDITYFAKGGYLAQPRTDFPRQYPSLPFRELLKRSHHHSFKYIDFDESSCEGLLKYIDPSVKNLSFSECTFADGGIAIGKICHKLKALTLVKTPLAKGVFSREMGRATCLKSLTISIKDILEHDGNSSGVSQLCGTHGLRHLRIEYGIICPLSVHRANKAAAFKESKKNQWIKFLESEIRDNPTLTVLEFIDYVGCSPHNATEIIFEPTLEFLKKYPNIALEKVQFQRCLRNVNRRGKVVVRDIREILRKKRQRKKLRQSPYRKCMLSRAIYASAGASHLDATFLLLSENSDIISRRAGG